MILQGPDFLKHVLVLVGLPARGDVVSIIGASGSGKSTFLRCINLLEMPNRGRITVSGEEVLFKPRGKDGIAPADMRQVERIRTRLGMVFQSFNLWAHMTVLQNVMEAPVHVLKVPKGSARSGPRRSSTASACGTSATSIRPSFRAASSSARRSRGRSP